MFQREELFVENGFWESCRCALQEVSVVGKLRGEFRLMVIHQFVVGDCDERNLKTEHFETGSGSRVSDYNL